MTTVSYLALAHFEMIYLIPRDGRVAQLENVYIRGSKIRFLILPDMLKNAPMFKRQGAKAASSAAASGRGKSAILRAQGKYKLFVHNLLRVLYLLYHQSRPIYTYTIPVTWSRSRHVWLYDIVLTQFFSISCTWERKS